MYTLQLLPLNLQSASSPFTFINFMRNNDILNGVGVVNLKL